MRMSLNSMTDPVATLLSDMSVTSCEGSKNSLGSGESRYDSPDAPLSNAATRSARHYRLFGSPPSLSFLLHGGDRPIPRTRHLARHHHPHPSKTSTGGQ